MDVDKIARKYPHARINVCAEGGCRPKTKPNSTFLILKGEAVDPHNKMCDCMMFRRDGKIVLVELKHRVQHVPRILEKFKRSIVASLDIALNAGSKANCITLILVSSHYRNPIEHDRIRAARLRYGGVIYRIETGRCNGSISRFLD